MEIKNAKVLDDGKRVLIDLKRKQASQFEKDFSGAAAFGSTVTRNKITSLDDCYGSRSSKKQRSNGTDGWHQLCVRKNYSNFTKSCLPKRLMIFQDGEWCDVPDELKDIIRESFTEKKAIAEVVFQGRHLIFDCLRMLHIDLDLGLQLPVAWIDDSDACFYPELDSSTYGEKRLDDNETCQIKVTLEISVETEGKIVNDSYIKPCAETKEDVGENGPAFSPYQRTDFELIRLSSRQKEYQIVQKMFLSDSMHFIGADNIEGIYQAPKADGIIRNFKHIFQKQVEITKNCRRNANIRYGWLVASSRDAAKDMFICGLKRSEMLKVKPGHGTGVHLSSAYCPYLSACHSDGDENALHHMVLCRVILGNMELVCPNSQQYKPSSKDFDSGVDDLMKPNYYIIWDMNVKTSILPEYVVSFRMPPCVREMLVDDCIKSGSSGITGSNNDSQGGVGSPVDSVESCQRPVSSREHSLEKAGCPDGLIRFRQRMPTSPWMPFPMLFAAVSDKIPLEQMDLVDRSYMEYLMKKISKLDLIKRLRMIIGDGLLKSTIMSIQCKMPVCQQSPMYRRREPVKWDEDTL